MGFGQILDQNTSAGEVFNESIFCPLKFHTRNFNIVWKRVCAIVKRLMGRHFIIFTQTCSKDGKKFFGKFDIFCFYTENPLFDTFPKFCNAPCESPANDHPGSKSELSTFNEMKHSLYRPAAWMLLLLLAVPPNTKAQTKPDAWGTLFFNGPYHGKWGLHLDAQVRSTPGMDQLRAWLFRPGLQYKLNKRNLLTLGYAYVEGRINSPGIKAITPEHRLWQQWIYFQPIRRQTLQHRFRIEERFIGSTRYVEGVGIPTSSIYSTRFRYFNRIILPWHPKESFEKGFFTTLQNEVFLHLTGGDRLTGKTFDQNRFYLALGYRINKIWDIETGYMRRDVQSTTRVNKLDTWQLAFYFRPD